MPRTGAQYKETDGEMEEEEGITLGGGSANKRGGGAEPSQPGWSNREGAECCVATTAGEDKSGRSIAEEAAPSGGGTDETRDCAER